MVICCDGGDETLEMDHHVLGGTFPGGLASAVLRNLAVTFEVGVRSRILFAPSAAQTLGLYILGAKRRVA